MALQNDRTDQKTSSFDRPPSPPTASSCRRKKSFGSGSFVSDLRDHFHEFLHASADEHRTCFRDTIRKIFKASKVAREKSTEENEGESSLPLQATVSD